MSLNSKLNKIINYLNISYKNKNISIRYKNKKNDAILNGILQVLVDSKMLWNFYLHQDGYLYAYLKYNELGEPLIKNFKIMYRRPFVLHFTLEELKSKKFKNNYILKLGNYSSFYIFSTSKGILSYDKCIELNVGGVMLLRVISA